MSLKRAIVANTAIQVAGKLTATVIGVATVAVMTRALGADGYGAFTTALTFLQFFGILVDFGLNLTLAKLLAEPGVDEGKVTSNVLTLRLTSAFVLFGLAPFLALAFPYGAEVKTAIAIGALSFFAMTGAQALGGLFQKKLATGHAAIAEVLGRGILLAGALLAAQERTGLIGFILALVAGNLVQFAYAFVAARKLVPLRPAFDMDVWKRIILESWPIATSIVFNLVYLKGDVIMLSIFRPQAEVGLYGAAYKVLDVVTVIPMIFMGLVMPILAASWIAGRRDEFRHRLGTAFDAMSLMAFPLVFGAWAVSGDLMRLVAGGRFAASGTYLAILMLAGAAVFWSGLFGHAVVAIGLQKKMIAAYAVDAALSVALYAYFIPRHGAIAAAWVTVFSEAFIMIVTAIVVIVATRAKIALRTSALAVLASVVMAAAIFSLPDLHVLPRIVVGMAVYASVLAATGVLSTSFIRQFRPSLPAEPVGPAA